MRMENKRIILCLAMMMALSLLVFADDTAAEAAATTEAAPAEAAPKTAEDEWQDLSWIELNPDSVLEYGVVLQERDPVKDEYVEINSYTVKGGTTQVQARTKDGSLLKPGNYRYKVITYNLIGAPAAESEWYEFTVYQAYQPTVADAKTSISLTSTVYLDEANDGIFTITGKNLFANAEDANDTSFTNYALVNVRLKKAASNLVPQIIAHDDANKKLTVQFDMDALDVGVYHFVATDASGLKSEDTKDNLVTVKFRKWLDIDVCAGYVIPVALYDDIFKTYLNTSVFPLSGAARVTVMPFKHRYGYLGAALSASYTRIYSPFDSYYIDGNMMIAHADFVYQLPVIKSRLTVEAHAGVGVTALSNLSFHFQHDINSDPLSSVNLSINAGGAAQLYVVKRLYVDVCVDYVQAFMTNMALGMIVPSASIGWQF